MRKPDFFEQISMTLIAQRIIKWRNCQSRVELKSSHAFSSKQCFHSFHQPSPHALSLLGIGYRDLAKFCEARVQSCHHHRPDEFSSSIKSKMPI